MSTKAEVSKEPFYSVQVGIQYDYIICKIYVSVISCPDNTSVICSHHDFSYYKVYDNVEEK